ncbi:metal ABC transporter substrate-binding protein [Tissierella praeacuta]|uniref:metal ABC transporter substrate-binding protein n=1 Tax=Tissierella praeacuta TaxID=43131 RepID=UPI003342330C
MKRIISFILIFTIIIFALIGCNSNSKDNKNDVNNKLKIVTTIFPQYDFVREIAGNSVDLTMLIKPGSESHSYEPTPQDIIKIQSSDIFIYVGGESDKWVDKILESMDISNMKIISLLDCVDAVEEEIVEGMEDEHDHDELENEEEISEKLSGHNHHEEIEYDEHVWTSPRNAIKIVEQIKEILVIKDQNNKNIYEANAKGYVKSLIDLDKLYKEIVSNASRKTIVFGDRFPFRYFADSYGLKYYAAFPGCSTESEASASTVAFLIDKVKSESIPVVFHIELSNEKMADVICESTGAKKLLMHSCHNITNDDFINGISYLDLMNSNAENLKEALK